MLFVEGKTGVPFVDANMRELAATGFMSNRGRQVGNVEYHKLSEKVQLLAVVFKTNLNLFD